MKMLLVVSHIFIGVVCFRQTWSAFINLSDDSEIHKMFHPVSGFLLQIAISLLALLSFLIGTFSIWQGLSILFGGVQ